MINANWSFETITDAYYTGQMTPVGDELQPTGRDLLHVATEDNVYEVTDCPGEESASRNTSTTTYEVPNGGFRIDNPTLQLFGYYGTSPSRFEDELPGQPIPIDENPVVGKHVAEVVFTNGRWSLESVDWMQTAET